MSPARAYADLRGSGPRQLARMTGRVWWATVTSGRFFTWWSAGVSFVVSVTVLGAYVGIDHAREYFPAIGASAIGWVILLVAVLPVAWAERRLPAPAARGALVIGTLVAVSVVRPFLNDAISVLLVEDPTIGGWPQRVMTNFLVWLLLLSLVAVATVGYATTRAVNIRLRAAIAALGAAERRADAFDRSARTALAATVDRVRERLAVLIAGVPGFEDVRSFSQAVRAASHELEDDAHLGLDEIETVETVDRMAADAASVAPSPPARRPLLSRLRPPPVLLISLVYSCASLPYTLQAAPWWLVVAGVLLALGLGYAADIATRRVARRPPQMRGLVLVLSWTLAGVLFSIAAYLLLPSSGIVALVPALAFPGVAVIAALSTDAIRHAIVQTRKLTHALADEATAVAARTARARRLLRDAAEQLHGPVQGRCVVFAASLDERDATRAEAEEFAEAIEQALEAVLAPPPPVAAQANELADTIAIWGHVLEIATEIDPDAADALSDGRVSREVSDIVSEGFLNAVKHSGARAARLRVSETLGGLRVEVTSRGELRETRRAPGRGVAHFGPTARVYQSGDDVVLEATVARDVPAAPPAPPTPHPPQRGARAATAA
jgi:hypothetical protein